MKHIKLFENFKKGDFKDTILNKCGLLDILYDLRDISLEYLDTKHDYVNDDGLKEKLNKKLVFLVDLHDNEVEYLGALLSGEVTLETPNLEETLTWSDDITLPCDEIEKGFESNIFKFEITLGLIVVDNGTNISVDDDVSSIYNKISEIYPEVGFDTFNPWDLN